MADARRVSPVLMRLVRTLLPIALYLGVAFALTAGVWHDPAHTWPGPQGDVYKFIDFMSWVPHAIAHGKDPFFMGVIDYPDGVNLTWETPALLGDVLIWPFTALLGPLPAYNVFILLSITLDGWCTYLWLRRHVRSPWAAAPAALLIALGPWVAVHAQQLNLISFWPLPLIFMAAEDLLRGERSRVWTGLVLGVLFAVQLYLAEELAVLAAIGLALAIVATVLALGASIRPAIPRVVASGAIAIATAVVLTAPLLIYQFRGPRRIHGIIHPPGFYVTDLQNFLIPTGVTWAWPQSVTAADVGAWSGPSEAVGYIGIPLLLIALYAVVRWWREPLVRIAGLTIAAAAILSLGPHLHIGGVDTGIRLPGVIFSRLPLLENLIPSRIALITAFGLAFLLAITLDRTLLRNPLRSVSTALVSVVGLAAIVSMVSQLPLPASSTSIPAYFQPGGGATRLPAGTVALVAPYIDDGAVSPVVMLWQAESDFHFALTDGLAITADANGNAAFLPTTPLRLAFDQIQLEGHLPAETAALRESLLATMHADNVSVIIVGPMQQRELAVEFIDWLTGRTPVDGEDVSVWSGPP
ncbi:MAG: hypothetical protein ACREN2_11260 [Candidatus Dormibacteria bacterium]